MPRKKINRKDKKCHHEFVWLAESEYAHLCELLGAAALEAWIVELNGYIGAKGSDPYESHYYTIQNWARRKAAQTATHPGPLPAKGGGERAAATVIDALKDPRHRAMPEFTPASHRAAYTALARMGISWPELKRRIGEYPEDLAEFKEKFLTAYGN